MPCIIQRTVWIFCSSTDYPALLLFQLLERPRGRPRIRAGAHTALARPDHCRDPGRRARYIRQGKADPRAASYPKLPLGAWTDRAPELGRTWASWERQPRDPRRTRTGRGCSHRGAMTSEMTQLSHTITRPSRRGAAKLARRTRPMGFPSSHHSCGHRRLAIAPGSRRFLEALTT